MSTAAGSSLFSSKSWSEKMLAEESKSSSLVEPATGFLRHELRKIFIRHKKKKKKRNRNRGGDVSCRQKVHSEVSREMNYKYLKSSRAFPAILP